MDRNLPSLVDLYSQIQILVKGRLWLKVILGLIAGIVVGVVLSPNNHYIDNKTSDSITSWLALPGSIFIRLVQMVMIPLVLTSIIQGISGSDNKDSFKVMGPRIGIYFLLSTTISIIIGVLVVSLLKPGKYVGGERLRVEDDMVLSSSTGTVTNIPEIISRFLPINPLQSMMSGEMLSIIIFALIVGMALNSLKDDVSGPLLRVLYAVQEICMTITRWAMKLAPIAVFGLIAQVTAKIGLNALAGLSMYITSVLIGLIILMIVYSLIIHYFTPIGLRYFYHSMKDLLLLAYSVASSAAVMPMTIKTTKEKFNVSPEVSELIVPIGATVNMDGTALYQAIAAIFLAQVYHLDLSMTQILLLVITTVGASIGTPSAPGAGIIILASILGSVGIPVEGIAMIIGVDHLLGMCRTAVNVTGDVTACLFFNHNFRPKAIPANSNT